MIGDPVVLVECDECGMGETVGLTRTGRGWDDRGMEDSLRRQGWRVEQDGLVTICPDCVEEEKRKLEAEEAESEAEQKRAERHEWERDDLAWGPGEGYGYA
jgi:hypothetical protein